MDTKLLKIVLVYCVIQITRWLFDLFQSFIDKKIKSTDSSNISYLFNKDNDIKSLFFYLITFSLTNRYISVTMSNSVVTVVGLLFGLLTVYWLNIGNSNYSI
jgi:hypothetical protein